MFDIEQSALGRIVVPRTLPAGKALLYTTRDFDGAISSKLTSFIAERFGIDATLITADRFMA